MTKFEDESRLKNALIEKYGNKCHFCESFTDSLQIEHLLGQKELERQYLDKFERISDSTTDYDRLMHVFYYNNFEEESMYIGLVCKECKVPQKPFPRLDDILSVATDIMHDNNFEEGKLLISKYPQAGPIIDRRLRITSELILEEIQSRQDLRNGIQDDNLGEGFGR